MSDRPSENLDGLDINLARRIDEVCRQFHTDWRNGSQPHVEDYLIDVPDEGASRTAGRVGDPRSRAASHE